MEITAVEPIQLEFSQVIWENILRDCLSGLGVTRIFGIC